MKSCAQFISEAKAALGDNRMSDRELGDRLGGFAQQTIFKSKKGGMSDTIGLAIGTVLEEHGLIEHAGEVLLVAHAERDCDPKVRAALLSYAKKIAASVPSKAVSALCAFAVALGMFLPARDAQAFGGAGGIRTLEAGFAHLLP